VNLIPVLTQSRFIRSICLLYLGLPFIFQGKMNRERSIEVIGRLGYSAKGIVYALIGWMALLSAFGQSRNSLSAQGAVGEVWKQPLGNFWVAVLAVGLLGYSLWRALQAFLDTEKKGKELKGRISRTGFLISALVYGQLALYAGAKAIGENAGSGGGERRGAEALLSLPLGWIFVVLVGAVFSVVGLWQFYRAFTARFMKQYQSSKLNSSGCTALKWVGRVGIGTRGLCFIGIGIFFLKAGWSESAREAKGLSSVFYLIANDFGTATVVLMAFGFLVYGLYCFSQAAFRSF
jgi:hypothetical protein